jgi:glycosyltransferase involved in cell wall biosynthesis
MPETDDSPLATIITVVRNGRGRIEETINSVLRNGYKYAEYIIIDGNSTDGTADIIKEYSPYLAYWTSEEDRGVYDALNKGIKASKGHFIYTLNIGDRLLEFPVEELAEARKNEADVVLFNVQLSNGILFRSTVDFRMKIGNTIHHQGVFYRNCPEIFYDIRYKVYADFDLNQRLLIQRKKFIKYDKIVSFHSLDGISNDRAHFKEYLSVIKRNSGLLCMIVGYFYFKISETKMRLTASFRSYKVRQ